MSVNLGTRGGSARRISEADLAAYLDAHTVSGPR